MRANCIRQRFGAASLLPDRSCTWGSDRRGQTCQNGFQIRGVVHEVVTHEAARLGHKMAHVLDVDPVAGGFARSGRVDFRSRADTIGDAAGEMQMRLETSKRTLAMANGIMNRLAGDSQLLGNLSIGKILCIVLLNQRPLSLGEKPAIDLEEIEYS